MERMKVNYYMEGRRGKKTDGGGNWHLCDFERIRRNLKRMEMKSLIQKGHGYSNMGNDGIAQAKILESSPSTQEEAVSYMGSVFNFFFTMFSQHLCIYTLGCHEVRGVV